jgi:glycosyltransferase involved in cell wall biosynthesis
VALGLRAAHRVVAPTAAMLRALDCFYGPLPPCRVIPNGRRSDLFPPLAKEPLVLSAGRLWDEAKNVRALARVAPRLGWPVLVAGAAESPESPESPERQGGVMRGLRSLGPLPPGELARWLGIADIYALPARYEPFGLSILEAALAGCALVLGEIDSLRELWDSCAQFVPGDDEDALADTIGGLIRDPLRRRALARRAHRRALDFCPKRMADDYLRIYAEAAAERGLRSERSERPERSDRPERPELPERTRSDRPSRRPEERLAS